MLSPLIVAVVAAAIVLGMVAWSYGRLRHVLRRDAAGPTGPLGEGDGQPEPPAARGAARTIRASQIASLSDLAGGIAHEINNPVAIMIEEAGWIEDLLEDDEFRDCRQLGELRRAVREITTQGRRCKDITSNLLSFARRPRSRPEAVAIDAVVRAAVIATEARARERQATVETRCDAALPNVWVSPSEVQQVVVNLVNNAIDALEGRDGRVTITTAQDGDEVTVSVADTGCGIAPDHLGRIFDPFFTTKEVGKGTGLGLSICYGIVARLGGDIAVATTPGAGSVFTVRLPVRPAGQAAPAAPPRHAEADASEADGGDEDGAGAGTPAVVLVVDREVAFADALRRRLGRREVDVLSATSGADALAELGRRTDVDVVLLDVQIPGENGLDTLSRIKRLRPLVEVLLVSSDTSVEAAIDGLRLGAFDYLLKPCDLAQLLERIRRARRRKHRQEHRVIEARIDGIAQRRP